MGRSATPGAPRARRPKGTDQADPEPPPPARPQLLASAIVFLCGNLSGAFHKHQMQDASRDLFTYTAKCIQIRRKLRIEKRQQVGVLPPHPAWPSPRPGRAPGPTPCVLSLWTWGGVCLGRVAGCECRPHPRVPPGTGRDECLAGAVVGPRRAEVEGAAGRAGRKGVWAKPGA